MKEEVNKEERGQTERKMDRKIDRLHVLTN